MTQKTMNCEKCGSNDLKEEMRRIRVKFGAHDELQFVGLATAVICNNCGSFHLPNTFDIDPQAWGVGSSETEPAPPPEKETSTPT